MKYSINFKNVEIAEAGKIGSAEVDVEYVPGELAEVLGLVLPFVREMVSEFKEIKKDDDARRERRQQADREHELRMAGKTE